MSAGFSSSSSDHHHHHNHHFMDKENLFNSPHETDNEDPTGLTRRFSQSISLQTPETTFIWPEHPHAPPPTPSVKTDEWNQIYAAAGHVAQMKMKMSISDGAGGVIGGSPWRRSGGEELFRRQHIFRSRCVAAWPPPQVQNYYQHKPVAVGGGCDGGATAAKRGTGVFLPRGYCSTSIPPETRRRQEILMSRRKVMISGAQQRRSNIHGGVIESAVNNNPTVLLPQEWTY